MAVLVNLTPHTINVMIEGKETVSIAPSGNQARVSTTTKVVGEVNGVEVRKVEFGTVEGLPEPQADTYYLVSRIVASAVPTRTDVLVPDGSVRNEAGQIIGCTGFALV